MDPAYDFMSSFHEMDTQDSNNQVSFVGKDYSTSPPEISCCLCRSNEADGAVLTRINCLNCKAVPDEFGRDIVVCEACDRDQRSRRCLLCDRVYDPLMLHATNINNCQISAAPSPQVDFETKRRLLAWITALKASMTSIIMAVVCPQEQTVIFSIPTSEFRWDEDEVMDIDTSDAVTDEEFDEDNPYNDNVFVRNKCFVYELPIAKYPDLLGENILRFGYRVRMELNYYFNTCEIMSHSTLVSSLQAFQIMYHATARHNAYLLTPLDDAAVSAVIEDVLEASNAMIM